jgi:hypothetical protein
VLISHCLPTGASSPFWTDDYDAFLTWRETELWEEIKRLTGTTKAADLEAPDEEVAPCPRPALNDAKTTLRGAGWR